MSTIYSNSSWRWCGHADEISDSKPDFLFDSDATATDWRTSNDGVSDDESDNSEDLPSVDDAGTSTSDDDDPVS